MKTTNRFGILLAALVSISFSDRAWSDTFGSGANTFDIEFVPIGNPGNLPDTTGTPNPGGSVLYNYRIGKFEISEQMIDKANALGGLGITKDTRGPDKPATNVTWFEVAKFVNWLNTSTGSLPAYKFDSGGNFQLWQFGDTGYDPNNLYRNTEAKYFLPSVHEWYKSAYYDPTSGNYYAYPTGSSTAPTPVVSGTAADTAVYDQSMAQGPTDITLAGGLSPYGTIGQGGNVFEWEETDLDLVNDSTSSARGGRGGAWYSASNDLSSSGRAFGVPNAQRIWSGFRVASIAIPEPSSLLLVVMASLGLSLRSRALSKRFIRSI